VNQNARALQPFAHFSSVRFFALSGSPQSSCGGCILLVGPLQLVEKYSAAKTVF